MLVRATLTLRNAVMIEKRKQFHLSQIALAEVARVPTAFVQQIEKLDFSMFDGRPQPLWEQRLTAVAGVLEVAPEEIVPEKVRGKIFQTRFVSIKDVSPDRMLAHASEAIPALPLAELDVRLILNKVLPERQADAVRYVTLDGRTLSDAGKLMHVSKQSVSQNLRSAMQRLTELSKSGYHRPINRVSAFSEKDRWLNPGELEVVRNLVSMLKVCESRLSDAIPIGAFIKAAGESGLDVAGGFGKLTYKEQMIIRLRYGLDGYVYTLEEVGRKFKIARERVRQIETRGIRKLQDYLAAQKQLDEKEIRNASAQHP